MKKNDFKTMMKNEINEQNKKIETAKASIATTTATIEKLTKDIAEYSDFENPDKFTLLKADKAHMENTAELMKRQLKNISKADDSKIMSDLNAFNAEKVAIYKKYNDKIAEVTKELESINADVTNEINELTNLYNAWIYAFGVNERQISQTQINYFLDESGILPATRQYLSKLEQIRKAFS